jgi:anti-sigma-K factor RskA
VWSDARQEGYMRFRNLPRNEPTAEQYQLWIFDQEQSLDTPVDGGVFDIDASGELVVPIDAKLEVHEALAFAVTVEKPGGVVVSDRTRLILTAGL